MANIIDNKQGHTQGGYKGIYTPKLIAMHRTSKGHFTYWYHKLWSSEII